MCWTRDEFLAVFSCVDSCALSSDEVAILQRAPSLQTGLERGVA